MNGQNHQRQVLMKSCIDDRETWQPLDDEEKDIKYRFSAAGTKLEPENKQLIGWMTTNDDVGK
jgi:hypothetical protein